MDDPGTVTSILHQARGGSREAVDRLFPLLYGELQKLARHELRRQERDATLNTGALIAEAYLRMVDQTHAVWADRAHFFAYSARAMRAIVVDHARRRGRQKRGGGAVHVSFDDRDLPVEARADMLVALDEALERLARLNDRLCRIVECRFFGGMSEEETAEALGISGRTVRRDWLKAKAWLYADLSSDRAVPG